MNPSFWFQVLQQQESKNEVQRVSNPSLLRRFYSQKAHRIILKILGQPKKNKSCRWWLKEENGVSHGDIRKRGFCQREQPKRTKASRSLESLTTPVSPLTSHCASFLWASLPWDEIPLLKVYLLLLAEPKASPLCALGDQPRVWLQLQRESSTKRKAMQSTTHQETYACDAHTAAAWESRLSLSLQPLRTGNGCLKMPTLFIYTVSLYSEERAEWC